MTSIEETLEELLKSVPISKRKSKVDYDAVYEHIRKLKRPFTIGELRRFGPFNYIYQWVQRHLIPIEEVEEVEVDDDEPLFVRVGSVYIPVQLIKEKLKK